MCDRRFVRGLVLAAALLSCRSLGAQAADPLAAPRRAVLAAHAERRAARDAWVDDSVRRSTFPLVATIGAFTVRADSARIPRVWIATVQTALDAVVTSTRATLGPVADSLFANGTVSVARIDRFGDATSLALSGIGDLISLRANVPGAAASTATARVGLLDAAPMQLAFARLADEVVARSAAPAITRLGVSPLLRPWTAEERMLAYRHLRMSRSPSAAACVAGVIAACRVALALVPSGADTIDLWFDNATQQALVRAGAMDSLTFPARAPLHRACVTANDARACRAVLDAILVRSPTSVTSRRELVRLALVTGGPAAFARLQATRDTNRIAILETVAGVPVDSLVALWRADVLRGRAPAPVPPPAAWVWTGVTATLLFGLGVRRGLR